MASDVPLPLTVHPAAVPTSAGQGVKRALPAPPAGMTTATVERIAKIIELIRPAIQADGGDIEFVAITPDRVVQIRMHGACVGCPSSVVTLKSGIANNLRENVPELAGVEAVD